MWQKPGMKTWEFLSLPDLKKTGMARHRFEELWQHIRWSEQDDQCNPRMLPADYRWQLIDDFVKHFNDHRRLNFSPSDLVVVDELISKWYGLGGFWINIGLPQYVAIDRKPENGCEIQNACCARSRIMLQLKLVKHMDTENEYLQKHFSGDDVEKAVSDAMAAFEDARSKHRDKDGNAKLHGICVMEELLEPWEGSNRIVCADSYFASVAAVEALKKNGFYFIGVVKSATKNYPRAYLGNEFLPGRGSSSSLVSFDSSGDAEMIATVWVDQSWRYFIANSMGLSMVNQCIGFAGGR